MYFLLLHAWELALKSVAISRGQNATNSHDVIRLFCESFIASDWALIRRTYRKIRTAKAQEIRLKWSQNEGAFSNAAMKTELEAMRTKPISMIRSFRLLGALGQSEMTKREFGHEVNNWWHAARYPRLGTTSYPNFDTCQLICESLLDRAEAELEGRRKC